jgi:hypothetical protein
VDYLSAKVVDLAGLTPKIVMQIGSIHPVVLHHRFENELSFPFDVNSVESTCQFKNLLTVDDSSA